MKNIYCPKRNFRFLIFLVLLSILIRFLFFVAFLHAGFSDNFSLNHYPDSLTYVAPADSILNQGKYLNQQMQPDIYRTPGYPMFLSFCKIIFKTNWIWAAIIIQLLINIFSVVVLYKAIWILSGNLKAACLGSLVAALNLHDIYFCFFILSDSLSQSILLLSVFFLILFFLKEKITHLSFAAFFFSTGTFIRPAGLYLPILLAVVVLLYFSLQKMRGKGVIYAILLLLIGLLPEFLWQMRNEKATGYSGFSAIQEENLFAYHAAGILAEKNGTSFYQEQEKLKNNPEIGKLTQTMSLQEAQRMIAAEIITANVPVYLFLNLKGVGYILLYPGLFDIAQIHPPFRAYIANLKSNLLTPSSLFERVLNFLKVPYSFLTILNLVWLFVILLFTFLGIQRSFNLGMPWQLNVSLLCVMIYFLVIHAGPNGFGTYSRFRLSVSMLQAIYIGLFFVPKRKNNGFLDKSAAS